RAGRRAPKGVPCHSVSLDGQTTEPPGGAPGKHRAEPPGGAADGAAQCVAPSEAAVIVATFPMPAGSVFHWHTHPDHQLAWAASGVLTVRTSSADWGLAPTPAVWIPGGVGEVTL